MGLKILRNKFRISRLRGYAAYKNMTPEKTAEIWHELFTMKEHQPAEPFSIYEVDVPEVPAKKLEAFPISTNDAAIWSLDAIYLQEVLPRDE